MKNYKTKKRGILIAIVFVGMMLCSGLNSVSACRLNTPLLASKDYVEVGEVEVVHYSVYSDEMFITYSITEEGWKIYETHLAVATAFGDIPQTKINKNGIGGNPKVGKFPYKEDHPGGVLTYTYKIDLDDYGLKDSNDEYHGTLYFAAHAIVYNPSCGEETAWADTGLSFPGNNWALYFILTF